MEQKQYGQLDTSYQAAGKEEGIRKLCIDFYDNMGSLPEAKHIRSMHSDSLDTMIDKLTFFLSLWLGGPKDFIDKYGSPNMPQVHSHLVINETERDAWLLCMFKAIEKQDFDQSFKDYLREAIQVPANRIMNTAKS